MKNHYYNPGKFLRALLPEQTRSIPVILLWLVIYLLDLALVFWIAYKLDIHITEMVYNMRCFLLLLYVAMAGCLLWLEATVCNKIAALFR